MLKITVIFEEEAIDFEEQGEWIFEQAGKVKINPDAPFGYDHKFIKKIIVEEKRG